MECTEMAFWYLLSVYQHLSHTAWIHITEH